MPRARAGLDHPELELPEVRNLWQTEGLFSDHYLKARIRSNSWWSTGLLWSMERQWTLGRSARGN